MIPSFSPDGRFFVTAGDDGWVRFWSGGEAQPIGIGISHDTPLTRARVSADSRFLATATVMKGKKKGGVFIYDVSDPEQPKSVFAKAELGIARHIMFARDKPLLAALVKETGKKNFRLIVWDYKRHTIVLERENVSSRSNGFIIAPSGQSIILTTTTNDVQIVSLNGGEPLLLPKHTSRVLAVTLSVDEKWIATSTRHAQVRIWHRQTGKMAFDLRGHQGRVSALSFSPDSSILLSACYDGLVRVWQVETGELRAELEHTDPIQRMMISPDGRRLLSISSDRIAYLWNIKRTKLIARLKGHIARPFIASWHPDGQAAVTASADKTARYWDLSESPGEKILTGHTGWVNEVEFSPDGKTVATSSDDRTVTIWDAETGKLIQVLDKHQQEVGHVSYSADGKFLLSQSRRDGIARVWRLHSGESNILLPPAPHEHVRNAAFSPDGKLIYTNSMIKLPQNRSKNKSKDKDKDKSADRQRFRLDLWKTGTLQKMPMEILVRSPVISAQVSHNNNLFATSHKNGKIFIRDISNKRSPLTLEGECHTGKVVALQFSHDDKNIITSSTGAVSAINKTVAIWDTTTGENIKCFAGTAITSYGLRLSKNGKVLIIANNRAIRIVNTKNWSVTRSLHYPNRTNNTWYHSLSISPDGSLIAMNNSDPSVSIWNTDNGQKIKVLYGHRRGIRVTNFDHTGRRLITSSRDATARIWTVSLESDKLVRRAKERVPRCLTREERNYFKLSEKVPEWCFTLKKWPYHNRTKPLTTRKSVRFGNWFSNLMTDMVGLKDTLSEKYDSAS